MLPDKLRKSLWNVPADVFGHAVGHKIVRVANGAFDSRLHHSLAIGDHHDAFCLEPVTQEMVSTAIRANASLLAKRQEQAACWCSSFFVKACIGELGCCFHPKP